MNKHTGWIALTEQLSVRIEHKIEDMWIGVYWSAIGSRIDIWLCIFPTLPLHISYHRR